MAITFNDNFEINAPKPVRDTDVVGGGQAYATKEDIPAEARYIFMPTFDGTLAWRLVGGTDDGDWLAVPNVTSVAITPTDGIEVDAGSPITTAGAITLGINAAALLAHIGVFAGAEVNVQSDWDSGSGDSLILNKPTISDVAYNATSWNGNLDIATKNAIRDKFEALTGEHDAVTLNASATAGGLGLSTQEITFRAATNALTGYATAAHITAIEANTAKDTNVSTALSAGTITAITYGITSDGGADDLVLPEATTTVAGLLGADKWDEIVANTAHIALTNNPHTVTASQVGLGSVTNVATSDVAYNATSWNGNLDAATKNAIRDKIETMAGGVSEVTSATTAQLTVVNGTTTPALTIVIGAVSNGSTDLVTSDTVYDHVASTLASWVPQATFANGYVVGAGGLSLPAPDTWVKVPTWTNGANSRVSMGTGQFTVLYAGTYEINVAGSFSFTTAGISTTATLRLAVFVDSVEQTNLEVSVDTIDGIIIPFTINGLEELGVGEIISLKVRTDDAGTFTLGYGNVTIKQIGFEAP